MDTESIALVTKRTIEGAPYRETAAELGVSHTTVMRVVHKPDVKAIVEAGITKLLQRGLNPSVNTLCRLAAVGANTKIKLITNPETGQTYKAADVDKDLLKLSLDASKVILNHAAGTGPTTVINQLIYSQGTHAPTDELSITMLNRALGVIEQGDSGDVIDVAPGDK